jgi:hypothetical protein
MRGLRFSPPLDRAIARATAGATARPLIADPIDAQVSADVTFRTAVLSVRTHQ